MWKEIKKNTLKDWTGKFPVTPGNAETTTGASSFSGTVTDFPAVAVNMDHSKIQHGLWKAEEQFLISCASRIEWNGMSENCT